MKISVALAAYNGGKYIKEQLESVLSQLGEDDEVIVSDDNPSGDTAPVVNSIGDSRIRYIEGPGKGVSLNFGNAVENCSGDIIFLCDQDDVWLPGKVSAVMEKFESGADLVLHNAKLVDANLNYLSQNSFDIYRPGTDFTANFIRNSYVGCCMAFNSKVKQAAFPLPKDVPMHDWWIALVSIKKKLSIQFIEEPLLLWRRHGDNVTGSATSLKDKIRFRKRMAGCLKTVCHGKDQF